MVSDQIRPTRLFSGTTESFWTHFFNRVGTAGTHWEKQLGFLTSVRTQKFTVVIFSLLFCLIIINPSVVPMSETFFLVVCMFFLRSWIQQGPVLMGVRQGLFTCSLQHLPLSWPPGKLLHFSVMKYSCFSISQRQCGRWCLGSSPHEPF